MCAAVPKRYIELGEVDEESHYGVLETAMQRTTIESGLATDTLT
jgi:hypothetical protein